MSGQWITHWIEEVIGQNATSQYGIDLDAAFNASPPTPVLAMIVRLKLGAKNSARMKFVYQQYTPDANGAANPNVAPTNWGAGWGY